MLSLHSIHDARGKSNGRKVDEISPPRGCVSYFCPGHIPQRYGRDHPQKYRHYVVTYLAFSPDGRELLANLGGEHVYLFDINNPREALRYSARHTGHAATPEAQVPQIIDDDNSNISTGAEHENGRLSREAGRGFGSGCLRKCSRERCYSQNLSDQALEFKIAGNECFSKQNYYQAVTCYNQALSLAASSALLYANRAAALLKRGWQVKFFFMLCLILYM